MRFILIALVICAAGVAGCKSHSNGTEAFYDRYPQYDNRPDYFDKSNDYDNTNLNDKYSGSKD